MKKLALALEELSVQTFATADVGPQGYATDQIGTGETEPDNCFTCELSCGRNC